MVQAIETIWKVILVVALLGTCDAKRWVLLRIDHSGEPSASMVKARSATDPAFAGAHHGLLPAKPATNDYFSIHAEGPSASSTLGYLKVDAKPRMFYDRYDSSEVVGGHVPKNESFHGMYIDHEVSHLHLHYRDGTEATHRRKFGVLQSDEEIEILRETRGIEVTTIQNVNTKQLPTVVFVSAGYLLEDKSRFEGDVDRALLVLRGRAADLDSAPWPRYFSLVNFFAVFEPSPQRGASKPHGPGHQCDASSGRDCGPSTVVNNLDCQYGTPNPNRLGCNFEKVFDLGSFAPAPADVYVVLVNDPTYGGTGGLKVATLNNNDDLGTLLIHEVNHAYAGLADEYSYGFNDQSAEELPNCSPTGDVLQVSWRGWIPLDTAIDTPVAGCTFNNYYRPTQESCLMKSRHSSMCSVCREHLTKTLYSPSNERSLKLSKPRCPPENFRVYLAENETVTLAINHRFALDNSNVTIEWFFPDGTTFRSIPAVTVRGAQLGLGPQEVTVRVTDGTSYLLEGTKAQLPVVQNTTFLLRRRASGSTCSAAEGLETRVCTSSNFVQYSYCGNCTEEDGNCEKDAQRQPYTAAAKDSISLDTAESTVQAVAAVAAVVGFLFIIFAIVAHKIHDAFRPCELLIMTTLDQAIRVLSAIGAVIVLIIGVALLALCVQYLPRTAVFGKGVFIAILVLAIVVYVISVLKFGSVVARWSTSLIISAILIFICGLILFGLGCFGLYIVTNRESQSLIDQYEELWLEKSRDEPEDICKLQQFFTCSGFYHSCVPVPSSYCPRNCDGPNLNTNACLNAWQDFVGDTLRPVAILALVCAFIMILAALADFIFYSRLTRARATQRGRRSYRKDARAPVKPLTNDELAMVRREFAKADKSGDGVLQGPEVIAFLKAVFRETPPPDDEERIMNAGPIDFEQFIAIYFPHLKRSGIDPRQLTVAEAENAADVMELQQQQYNKLENHMEAAGCLSPEALRNLYNKYAAFEFDDRQDFAAIVEAAAKEIEGSEDAEMCRGLTAYELEGLRCAWTSIHPSVSGVLTDRELDHFYQLSHDEPLQSQEHFIKWKKKLDIRKLGVGWPEFCYPYAQKALLRKARELLANIGKTVEPEMIDRAHVMDNYNVASADNVFLPYEVEVPIERVVALALDEPDA